MPLQSKIASPAFEDGDAYMSLDYPSAWSPPLPAAHTSSHPFLEDDPDLRYHSGAVSAYGRNSYVSGSASSDPHNSRAHSLSNLASKRPPSHLSISSDDPDTNTELIVLRSENTKLRFEVHHLRGQLAALSESHSELLNALGQKIDRTREDVRNMVQQISTKFIGPIPGARKSNIPLNPDEDDFAAVQFWAPGTWQEIRKASKATDIDEPVFSKWMEDEFGEPIIEPIRNNLREDAHSFWTDMYSGGEIPKTWNSTGLDRKESFRIVMEGKYPWLRLCHGHWKVRQLWINQLPQWKKAKLPRVVIEIPSSSEDDDSIGSKRGHNDKSDAGASKRTKYEVPTPNFHPARPIPKRKGAAKLAKTDPFKNIKIAANPADLPGAFSGPVASGSGTVHSSPPPSPQVTVPTPRAFDNTPGASSAAPHAKITLAPNATSTSPTPVLVLVSAGPRPSQIIPATPDLSNDESTLDPPTPDPVPAPANHRLSQIIPITPDPPSGENILNDPKGSSPSSSSITESLGSSDPLVPAAKKAKGPFPFKRLCHEAWMKKTKGTNKQFKSFWKKLDQEEKQAEIDAIRPPHK